MLRSNKGFLLLDALICVFVTASMCSLCFAIYKSIMNYDDGYLINQERSNSRYESIYNNLDYCEVCQIDESD